MDPRLDATDLLIDEDICSMYPKNLFIHLKRKKMKKIELMPIDLQGLYNC